MKKTLILFLIFTGLQSFAQTPLKQANEAYKKGDYQTAISLYEKALQNGKVSGEVYYNLGNAYYKLNQIAPSVYYYEKALQLLPGDEDITYNLGLANQMKLDKIEKVPENILVRFKKQFNRIFPYDTWAWLTVFSAFLGLLAFGIFLFSSNSNYKRTGFVVMFIALFSLILFWFNAEYGKLLAQREYAIVFVPQTELLTEPNLTADKVISLHEGTKVQVLQRDGNWALVKLPDGKKAWLPKADIKSLNQ